jgi:hypothetical protein
VSGFNAFRPDRHLAQDGIAIWRKEDPTAPVKIADGELTLAQTIWDSSPPDRRRARALAVRGRDRLGAGVPGSDAKRAEIEAWLAAHGGPAARR